MQILGTFGLNIYLLVTQIINFLIIFYLLKRFLFKPINNVLQKRQKLAQDAIDAAKENETVLEKSKEQEKEIIKKAKVTADEVIKEAREQSDSIIKKAEEDAKQRADKMLKDAKEQIALETAQAQKELNNYVVKLSVNILEKSLRNVLSEKEQSEIVAKAMKEIQKLPN